MLGPYFANDSETLTWNDFYHMAKKERVLCKMNL